MTRLVVLLLAMIVVVAEGYLLFTGNRLLVSERRVLPGEYFEVEGWGNLGAASQASLACHYFTGRSIVPMVFWYSADNVMGRDSCPFLLAG